MRISDWSSDVCSSYLYALNGLVVVALAGVLGVVQVASEDLDGLIGLLRASRGDAAEQQRCDHEGKGPAGDESRTHWGSHDRRSIRHSHVSTRRSEEHTSELQSLMRISYAVFCLKKKKNKVLIKPHTDNNQ